MSFVVAPTRRYSHDAYVYTTNSVNGQVIGITVRVQLSMYDKIIELG